MIEKRMSDNLLKRYMFYFHHRWQMMCPLRQFQTIPEEIIRIIEKENISWDRFSDLNAHEIGRNKRIFSFDFLLL